LHICIPAVPVDIEILQVAPLVLGLRCTAASYLLLRSAEVADLSQISELFIKRFAMRNSEKWISLPVSRHSSPTVSIAETIYEIHVGISLICKLLRHFDHLTELQYSQTAASQDCAKLVTRCTARQLVRSKCVYFDTVPKRAVDYYIHGFQSVFYHSSTIRRKLN
jgi:hypothetical protein